MSVLKKDGRVFYFVGGGNYFSHSLGAVASFRFALATLMENGHVRACELARPPLCLPHRTLMNWRSQLRAKGAASFFRPGRRSSASVMTRDKVMECEGLLVGGLPVSAVAQRTAVNEPPLRKALKRGAVGHASGESIAPIAGDGGTAKAERSRAGRGKRAHEPGNAAHGSHGRRGRHARHRGPPSDADRPSGRRDRHREASGRHDHRGAHVCPMAPKSSKRLNISRISRPPKPNWTSFVPNAGKYLAKYPYPRCPKTNERHNSCR